MQFERQRNVFVPSIREYCSLFGVNKEILQKYGKSDLLIMHPGPINRGIELSSDVADGGNSLILDQTQNGVAVRMAVLFLIGKNYV